MKLRMLILLLLIIPVVFGMSFDEFVQTYDFDFSTGQVNVSSIVLNPCIEPCTNLSFELEIKAEPGSYELFATFGKETDSKSKYFFGGKDYVDFVFMPPFNGSEFWLKAVFDNVIIYYEKIETFDISNITFEYVQVNMTEEIVELIFLNDSIKEGDLLVEYHANGTAKFILFDLFSNFITNTTSNSGIALFDGNHINASQLNGPYKVVGVFNGKNYGYETRYYNYGEFNKSSVPVNDYNLCKGKNKRRLNYCFIYKFFKKNHGKKFGWFKKEKKEKNLNKKELHDKGDKKDEDYYEEDYYDKEEYDNDD